MQINEIVSGPFGGLIRKRTGEQVSINPAEQRQHPQIKRLREIGVGQTFQVGGKLYRKLTEVDAHGLVAVLRLGPGRPTKPVMVGNALVEV